MVERKRAAADDETAQEWWAQRVLEDAARWEDGIARMSRRDRAGMVWQADLKLEHLRQRFLGGDNFALLRAVSACASAGIPLPAWAVMPLVDKVNLLIDGETDSLEGLFGRPHPPGTWLSRVRQDRAKGVEVYCQVRGRAQNRAIDDSLFEAVGKDLGLGRNTVSRLYYETKRAMDAENAAFEADRVELSCVLEETGHAPEVQD